MKRTAASIGAAMVIAAGAVAALTAASDDPPRQDARPRELTAAELPLIERAEEQLVQQCMATHGFRYWPAEPLAPDERRSFPYVVDDVAWAREHGYGGDIERQLSQRREENPNARYAAGLSLSRRAAYEAAYSGNGSSKLEIAVPSGVTVGQHSTGCIAESQETLYGDFGRWFRASTISTNLPTHAQAITAHRSFEQARVAWSQCMDDEGLRYKGPPELRKSLERETARMSPNEAQAHEIRLATAEAFCARRTPLSKVLAELTRRYDAGTRAKYGEHIEARNTMRLNALARAKEIVTAAR